MRADGTIYPVEVHLQVFEPLERAEVLGDHPGYYHSASCRGSATGKRDAVFSLANTIPQLAWIANTDGSRSWYNQRWYDYTGTTPEEVLGWGWQKLHDAEMLPKVIRKSTDAVAAGEAFDMEFPLRGADGSYRIFLTRAEPLRDTEGRIVQWFGTNTDVNEQRLEEKVRRETEKSSR